MHMHLFRLSLHFGYDITVIPECLMMCIIGYILEHGKVHDHIRQLRVVMMTGVDPQLTLPPDYHQKQEADVQCEQTTVCYEPCRTKRA